MHVGRFLSVVNADSSGQTATASTGGLSQDKSTLLHVICWEQFT